MIILIMIVFIMMKLIMMIVFVMIVLMMMVFIMIAFIMIITTDYDTKTILSSLLSIHLQKSKNMRQLYFSIFTVFLYSCDMHR